MLPNVLSEFQFRVLKAVVKSSRVADIYSTVYQCMHFITWVSTYLLLRLGAFIIIKPFCKLVS